MVNLVKAIESVEQSDPMQMNLLKKQLRVNKSEINKLRKSKTLPMHLMAPIHASVVTHNTEILRLILNTSGVDVDLVCTWGESIYRGPSVSSSVLDLAFMMKPQPPFEIFKLLIEHVRTPFKLYDTKPLGVSIPFALRIAVVLKNESLGFDVLDLLIKKGLFIQYGARSLSLLHVLLIIAIYSSKPCVLSHLLKLPEAYELMEQLFSFKGKDIALLEFARLLDRAKICEQLENFLEESQFGLVLGDIYENTTSETIVDNSKGEDGIEMNSSNSTGEFSIESFVTKEEQKCKADYMHQNETKSGLDKADFKKKSGHNVAVGKINYCWNCESFSNYMCAGCRKARYCGDNCQADDWV